VLLYAPNAGQLLCIGLDHFARMNQHF